MLSDARFLGEARTRACFRLLDCGPYPGVVPGDGVVAGELYAVPDSAWEVLDRYEGVPELFQRHQVVLASGVEAWIYLMEEHAIPIHSQHVRNGRWPISKDRG